MRGCEEGQYAGSHIVTGVYLGISFLFEFHMSKKIVKIIQPLSGHNRLSIMQYVKLVTSALGKLDMYTDFCFVSLAYSCDSLLAPFSLMVMIFLCSIMFFMQARSWYRQEILGFQLTEFNAFFDLLGKYETMYLEGEKSSEHTRL